MGEWRAQFDAEVTFVNGGSLRAAEFRLDIPGEDISDQELGELFVRHLGLLMVGTTLVANKVLIEEPHKGSRGVESGPVGRRIVDLSHPLRHGMITHTGLPGPEISDYMSFEDSRGRYADGTEFVIGRIDMVSNTGTYVDAPAHRFRDGADLSKLDLRRLVDLDGVVVRVEGEQVIDRAFFLPLDVRGKAVLVQTGWSRHWGTEEYVSGRHPYLTDSAAEWLVAQGVGLVGIDSMNVDDTDDGTRPVHTRLLRAGVPVVEHMTGLGELPPAGFRFHAAPPAAEGMATFTIRAYAVIAGPSPAPLS